MKEAWLKSVFAVILTSFCVGAAAQLERGMASRHLNKADLHEYLLYKSNKERTKAIATVIIGPLLTATGVCLFKKDESFTGNGGVAAQEVRSPYKLIGILIGSIGISTTISSVPLFLSAASLKKEARLVLINQTAIGLQNSISVKGVGLRISF